MASREEQLFTLFNEIGIINQLASTKFERLLPGGLSLAQFSVLNNFVRLGGVRSPAELAEAFQVTKGAMTNTLNRLSANGYVTVTPSPSDGRKKEVRITPLGKRMREAAVKATFPMLKEVGAEIRDVEPLLPTLQKLRGLLDRERG